MRWLFIHFRKTLTSLFYGKLISWSGHGHCWWLLQAKLDSWYMEKESSLPGGLEPTPLWVKRGSIKFWMTLFISKDNYLKSTLLASNFKCLNSEHQQFHFFHMYIRPCEKKWNCWCFKFKTLKVWASRIFKWWVQHSVDRCNFSPFNVKKALFFGITLIFANIWWVREPSSKNWWVRPNPSNPF